MADYLVLGLGNTILRDEGLGVRAVDRLLERYVLPDTVEAVEGGTLGLHLLPYLEGVRSLLIVDAVRLDAPAGSVVRLEGDDIPRALAHKVSLHQVGLSELLAVSGTQGALPERVVLWGMAPGAIEPGLDLTRPVATSLDVLVDCVAAELESWGVALCTSSPSPRD